MISTCSRDVGSGGQGGAQRAKIVEKVHKPPLAVNVINFELNGLMLPYGSPGVPQSPKRYNSMIPIHKISVITT